MVQPHGRLASSPSNRLNDQFFHHVWWPCQGQPDADQQRDPNRPSLTKPLKGHAQLRPASDQLSKSSSLELPFQHTISSLKDTFPSSKTGIENIMASLVSPDQPKPNEPEPDQPVTDAVPFALTGLQVVGGAVAVGALLTPFALGVVGFSAIGPVAGTAAAAWQSSVGVVGAGSLFAWCQSAAMGGAAAAAVTGTGIGGGVVAAGATMGRYLRRNRNRNVDTPHGEDDDDDEDRHEEEVGHEEEEGHNDEEGHEEEEGRDDEEGHEEEGHDDEQQHHRNK